jgi:hypothetical protein
MLQKRPVTPQFVKERVCHLRPTSTDHQEITTIHLLLQSGEKIHLLRGGFEYPQLVRAESPSADYRSPEFAAWAALPKPAWCPWGPAPRKSV